MKKVICGIVFLLFCLIPALALAAPFAYITNESSSNVSVIDTATNTVSATIPVGISPAGIAVNPSGTFVYVANEVSNTISVIDTATNTVTATIISMGVWPYGIAVNPSGTRVYVANYMSWTVSVIDTASDTVIGTPIGVGSSPFGVAVNPSGTRVYVVNSGSNNVSVIDTATNTVSATVPVGISPGGIAVNPSGTFVYVSNRNYYSYNVSVIDTSSNTVTATIPVGSSPTGVTVNPSGTRVYVANYYSNNVSVIDTATNTVTATIPVEWYPYGIAVNPSGTRVYVANAGSNNVSVIDTASNTVTATIPVGNRPAAFGNFIGPNGPAISHTITASAGSNGSISPSGAVSVNHGASQTFTIAPSANYHVLDVLADGSSVGAVTSYTFTNVTAAHTISATFAIDTHTLTASAGANGSISPSGAVSVNHSANQTFTITPSANYHVLDVLVDGSSVGAVTSYTFTNVTATHTISASFAMNVTSVCVQNGICITFSQVSNLCTSSACILSILGNSPGPAPSGYTLIALYDITTCATYTGPITVTIPYDESLAAGREGSLRMFHWENGAWRDVTVSVDTVNNTITGRVNSLSPFGIGYGSGSGYSTGANTNLIVLLAMIALFAGMLILRKSRWIRK